MNSSKIDSEVLVYDNSGSYYSYDQKDLEKMLNVSCLVVRDGNNSGIAKAYNTALIRALERRSDWLVVLDDDTIITQDYFNIIVDYIMEGIDYDVMVPKLKSRLTGKLISPSVVFLDNFILSFDGPLSKYFNKRYFTALNSGCVFNVGIMLKSSGFNNEFPLDLLDHITFKRINLLSGNIKVLEVTLIHDLSVENKASISFSRFKSIIDAEKRYYCNYSTKLFKIIFKVRLFKRAIYYLVVLKKYKEFKYLLKTMAFMDFLDGK